MVHLWRGFHSPELVRLLKSAWETQELLVVVPGHLKDFSFLRLFDSSQISFQGDWPDSLKATLPQSSLKLESSQQELLKKSVLGVFTSGTTSGSARLVLYSKENVLSSLEAIRELYDTQRIRKIFSYPQPTHTFGLVLGYLHAVLFNLELRFVEGAYSRKAHELWFSEVDATTLTLGTPTHFVDLINFVKSGGKTPLTSYTAIVGGARTTQELWKQMQSVLKIEAPSVGYGATEASPGVSHLAPGVMPLADGDIGYPLKGVKVDIVTDEGIYFQGPNLCLAIFENEGLRTYDRILLKDSLVPTEDPARPRLNFVGRTDLIVNRGGLKASLEMIEGNISSRFAVKAIAVAMYDERLGEDVAVLVQAESESQFQEILPQVQKILVQDFGLNLSESNFINSAIPLNASGKFDRQESLKRYLKTKKWTVPFSVQHLKAFLPHRGSAVWVKNILEFRKDFGSAQVVLEEGGNYFTNGRIRESACIEWMAQAYGYTVAICDIADIKPNPQATKTFIAEVRNSEFYFRNLTEPLIPGQELKVDVTCTHDFGVLKVVDGKVFFKDTLLAHVNMKLYCG